MASGPWDNVQLQGPPNGPAWANAAANLMGATQGSINNAANQYQNWQNFNYQQQQRNLFSNGLPTDANGQPDRAAIIDQLIKSGGAPAAQALLPSIMQQPFRDLYLKRLQGDNSSPDNDVNSGPATSSHAAGPANIVPGYGGGQGGGGGGGAENVNTIIGKIGANIPENVANRIARSVGAPSTEDDLTSDQAGLVQQRVAAYLKRNGSAGGANPVSPSGTGDQEAASGNQLNPSVGPGGPPMSPRQGAERRIETTPATGTDRINAAYGNPPAGAAATVPPQYRNDPSRYLQILRDRQQRKNEDARLAKLAGFDSTADEKAADQIGKQIEELQKRLGEDVGQTGEQKNERSGVSGQAKRRELQQTRYEKQESGIQASDRAAFDSDEDMRAMRGILNDPKLFTMGGNELVGHLRGALINAGLMDPNARLPNEALKKITAKAMQAQIAEMRDDAAQMGGSANRIMLAQVRIMQDAAQNPDMSPSGLRYLTEIMERANARTHDIAQLARDHNRQNGNAGLDASFDQKLANYNRTHPMMTEQEIENHHLLAAPHLPDSLVKSGAGEVARWAHQQGLKTGDPIRIPNTDPPRYKFAP